MSFAVTTRLIQPQIPQIVLGVTLYNKTKDGCINTVRYTLEGLISAVYMPYFGRKSDRVVPQP
jgi:hypothetical protein